LYREDMVLDPYGQGCISGPNWNEGHEK